MDPRIADSAATNTPRRQVHRPEEVAGWGILDHECDAIGRIRSRRLSGRGYL